MTSPSHRTSSARLIFPALLAWVAGAALQLQQAELLTLEIYAIVVLGALALLAYAALKSTSFRSRLAIIVTAFALSGFGATGLRAAVFLHQALDPALQGRDISVTGLIAAMPQRSEAGLRLRLEVESAQLDGQPVRLPPSLYLGWYGRLVGGDPMDELQRSPAAMQAGERWRMNVRLKAPHGGSNPHGFDFELWLWEQGLQATGYVRAGPKDPMPQRLGSTWSHPVEQLRQRVRDAIFARLASGEGGEGAGERKRLAGVVAALVVGDQQAIDGCRQKSCSLA